MNARTAALSPILLVIIILFGLCLAGGNFGFQKTEVLVLGALLFVSDFLALPLPKRGFLSYSFIWAFVLCAAAGSAVSAILLCLSMVVRFAVLGRGQGKERATDFASEAMPAFLSLCLFQNLSGIFASSNNHLATAVSLAVYYLGSEASFRILYGPLPKNSSEILGRSLNSRQLQLRINTMFSPAAVVLLDGGPTQVLWLLPVLLATHQFFWDRFSELKKLQKEGEKQKLDLRQTETALEFQSQKLDYTRNERDLVQKCLMVFSETAGLEPTAQTILKLLSEMITANKYALFWNSDGEFGPLLAVDRGGRALELARDQFTDLALLQTCYHKKRTVSSQDNKSWCFPLFERGVLYLGEVAEPPSKAQKQSLVLLTRQATFGLRSALLFEELEQTIHQERQARAESEQAREEALAAKHELEVAQSHLIQSSKLAAVGQLAAGVAHELNSPLAAILLSAQAGQRNVLKANYEKASARFKRCEEAAESAMHIVNGLLTHSKQTSRETALVSVLQVVEEACDFLSERLAREGTKITVSGEGQVESEINAGEISQILTNLVLNAHRSMKGRPPSSRLVAVSVTRQKNSVLVEVSDQGCGITAEHRERIFDPFFTTDSDGQGSGLGLYISSELAQKNEGELTLKSSTEEGSIFLLTLPCSMGI